MTLRGRNALINRKTRNIRNNRSFLPAVKCVKNFATVELFSFTSKHSDCGVDKRNYDKNTIKTIPIVRKIVVLSEDKSICNCFHQHFHCKHTSEDCVTNAENFSFCRPAQNQKHIFWSDYFV